MISGKASISEKDREEIKAYLKSLNNSYYCNGICDTCPKVDTDACNQRR